MPPDVEIDIADFADRSTALLDDLSRGIVEGITVTREGAALAHVSRVEPVASSAFEEWRRQLAGTVRVAPGVDLTEPSIHPEWETEWLAKWDERLGSAR